MRKLFLASLLSFGICGVFGCSAAVEEEGPVDSTPEPENYEDLMKESMQRAGGGSDPDNPPTQQPIGN